MKIDKTKGISKIEDEAFYLGIVSGTIFTKSDKKQLQIGVPQGESRSIINFITPS
jgi:hypothetical protein